MSIRVSQLANEENAYFVTTGFNSISGTSEHPYLYIKNPSASPTRIMITHFVMGVNSSTSRSLWKFYKNPTVTADGSALTLENTYVKASPKTSAATAFKDPTVTASGALIDHKIVPANSSHIGVNRFYWMDPDNTLLVTVQNSVASTSTVAGLYLVEHP